MAWSTEPAVGRRLVRRVPDQLEGDPVALGHRELGDGREVLAVQVHRGAQEQTVGPGDHRQPLGSRRTHGTIEP